MYHTAKDNILGTPKTNKAIILDLDETLVSTQDEEHMQELFRLKILTDARVIKLRNRTFHLQLDDLENPGSGTRSDMWGITRPYTHEFLLFCFSYFKYVIVWSAGLRDYVYALVDYLFQDLPQPYMIFTRDDTKMGEDGNRYKPLSLIISQDKNKELSLNNMLALDDWSLTYRDNRKNGVHIPKYKPDMNITSMMKDEQSLLEFQDWLLRPEVIAAKDVRKLNKEGIFTGEAE